ncbi:MAG TPA: hypothetical protein VFL57_22070 [Bryobacteraceae bacterium]|nr:hypothetical protein [Bryobacteraceae bacterium]
MRFPTAFGFEPPVDSPIDLNVCLARIPASATADDARIGSLPIGFSDDFVTNMTHWESVVGDEQQIGPPALISMFVHESRALPFRLNAVLELP